MFRKSNAAPSAEDLVRQFAHDLRLARRAAGDPSYRDIAAAAERLQRAGLPVASISITSISRILKGETRPSWRMTAALLAGCDIAWEVLEDEWLPRWRQLQEALKPIGDGETPGRPAPARPPGAECARCGAWVTNPAQHDVWHEQLERGAERGRAPRPIPTSSNRLLSRIRGPRTATA
jgi:transcriptional regulator with XRE-family HTH domain